MNKIGHCHRLAFTVSVTQHMHKTTNLRKFELNRSSKLRDNNERRKHPCHTKLCAFRWLMVEIKFVENYFFLQNYGTSEGAVSHNVLYHQPLPLLVTKKGFVLIIILSKSNSVHCFYQTRYSRRWAYIQTFRKKGNCSDEFWDPM